MCGTHGGGQAVDLRMRVVLWFVVAGLLASGCGGDHAVPTTTTPTMASTTSTGGTARFPLEPSPPKVVEACRDDQRTHPFVVLCPTRLPRGIAWYRPDKPPAKFHVYQYTQDGRSFQWYSRIVIMYGGPDERPGHGRLNTPNRFLHFEMISGYWRPSHRHAWIRQALEIGTMAGDRPLQRLLGWRRLGGHGGRLFAGLPYGSGGGELGGHLTFVWRDGGVVHGASLHAWTPRRQTLAVLDAIIQTLAPVQNR